MQASYDLLIGADGVRSAVRLEMTKKIPGFHATRVDHNFVFKLVNIHENIKPDLSGSSSLDFWDWPVSPRKWHGARELGFAQLDP